MPEHDVTTGPGAGAGSGAESEGVSAGTALDASGEVLEAPAQRRRERKRIGVAAWLSIAWIVGLTLVALVAKWLPIDPPTEFFTDAAREAPSAAHWFGTDGNGRDVFGLSVYGAKVSLMVGFLAVAMGFVFGGILGLAAGYLGGWTDRIISVLFDTFLAIPGLVLALALVATLDPAAIEDIDPARRVWYVALALGVVSIPILGRITRASTLTVADREFVTAARAMGARPLRIIWRDVVPNVLPAMLSIGLLGMGIAIVAEGGLALLGASTSAPNVSWGSVIAANQGQIAQDRSWMVFGPSIFLFLTVVALNYLGDVVRKRFDIRDSVL